MTSEQAGDLRLMTKLTKEEAMGFRDAVIRNSSMIVAVVDKQPAHVALGSLALAVDTVLKAAGMPNETFASALEGAAELKKQLVKSRKKVDG